MADSALRVWLEVREDGTLRRLKAEGHGGNGICAAATLLIRSVARECEAKGFVESGSAEKPGEMEMTLYKGGDWLRGATDILMRGLEDLQRESPQVEVKCQSITT